MIRKYRFIVFLVIGIILSIRWFAPSSINSWEKADHYLHHNLLGQINVHTKLVSDTAAYTAVIPPIKEEVPDPTTFPLYGAQRNQDANVVYLEIYSSAEKANGERESERWLVDVAEQFNQQRQTLPSGQVIQVGIRNIPSGLGAQVIAAGKGKPNGYTPANQLWLELLKAENIKLDTITPMLVENQSILAIHPDIYQRLAKTGTVSFERVLDSILAGETTIGYSNPYIASSALNFLHTLLWQGAGHAQDGKPLSLEDIASPAVNSVFSSFQKQVALTTPTYLDLKQIWLRDRNEFQTIVMAYQSYYHLKQQPGFENLAYVPFGIPENSPLVSFEWTTADEKAALKQFTKFAQSQSMQQLAGKQGFIRSVYLAKGKVPPVPTGEVLKAAQSLWKTRKDGEKSVYMQIVVDTSGSMAENQRLDAVKNALKLASRQINAGNQVGLVTFDDDTTRRIALAPFSTLEQKRLFAAIDSLHAVGRTALYDGLAVGLADLMEKQALDPEGRFYLLLLTDGQRTQGLGLSKQLRKVIEHSRVRIYPIAYGAVNQRELEAIAAIREGVVYEGTPEKVSVLLKNLFQTNL
jgi:Ca-activated chloride channel homolog